MNKKRTTHGVAATKRRRARQAGVQTATPAYTYERRLMDIASFMPDSANFIASAHVTVFLEEQHQQGLSDVVETMICALERIADAIPEKMRSSSRPPSSEQTR